MNAQILTKINNFTKDRLLEFLGTTLVLVSIFLLSSIVTYSPSDPNFIYTPENTENKKYWWILWKFYIRFFTSVFGFNFYFNGN